MIRKLRDTRPASPSGTAALELAVVLPLLLLIVLGCVDYGRAMHVSIALENAVGSGSDYAATHRFTDYTEATWESRIRDRVTEELQGVPNFDAGSLAVVIEKVDGPNNSVRVTVTATYSFTSAVDWPGVPNNLVLRHCVSTWQYR